MKHLINMLGNSGLLKRDFDYHLLRTAMVIIFAFFGYQKWFEYEAKVLIPYIANGPLISWMYPVFGRPAMPSFFTTGPCAPIHLLLPFLGAGAAFILMLGLAAAVG